MPFDPLLILLGLGAGVMSGLFGIGGGVIMVPILIVFFAFAPVPATATSLAALLLPVGILGVLEYYRKGMVNVRAAAYVALGLITTTVIGAFFALNLPADTFQQIYGVFLLYNAWRFIEPLIWLKMAEPKPKPQGKDSVSGWILFGVGLFAGVLAGMFGIGGGVVIVPLLSGVLGLNHKKAVATSLAAQLLPFGLPGVLLYYSQGVLNFWNAVPLAAGLLFGALVGARTALKLPDKLIKRLYGIFLLVVGVWFIIEPFLNLGANS